MRDCLKTFITPASISISIGGLSAAILLAISHTEGNDISTAEAASHYLSIFANLAAKNTIAGLCIANTITTALVYTFVAKPVETFYKKCCATNNTQQDENTENPVSYTQI